MRTANFAQDLLSVQTELLNFAYKLTADREEANDLLQETSLKALDNEEKYTAETNFKGWVYTIMRNIFIKVGSINSIFYFLHKAAEPFNCLEQDNLA